MSVEGLSRRNAQIATALQQLRHPEWGILPTHYRHRRVRGYTVDIDKIRDFRDMGFFEAEVMQDLVIPKDIDFPLLRVGIQTPIEDDNESCQEVFRELNRTTDGVLEGTNNYFFNFIGQAMKLVSVVEFEPTGHLEEGEETYDSITYYGSGHSEYRTTLTARDYGRVGTVIAAIQDGDFLTYVPRLNRYEIFSREANRFIQTSDIPPS